MQKNTSPDPKVDMEHRINRAIGQLEAVKRAIREESPDTCKDVIYQIKAARNALKKVSDLYVTVYLEACMAEKCYNKKDKVRLVEALRAALES